MKTMISTKAKQTNTKTFKSTLLTRTLAVIALTMSSSVAMAAPTSQPLPVKPVNELSDIDSSGVSIQNSTRISPVGNDKAQALADLESAQQELQNAKDELAAIEAEEAETANQVTEEIQEQTEDDGETGQAVEVSDNTKTDDSSIDSIVNKGGKKLTTTNLSNYAKQVNSATWSPNMRKNTAMTVKLQALLDWNHASPGPIDGGWGMNSTKALGNFQAMRGLPSTGKMDAATWRELTKNINTKVPVLVEYTLTQDDVNTKFMNTPSGSEAKSKLKGLYYQNIKEMLGERFHMDVRYLEKLNKGKKFVAGETITVINVGDPLKARIDRVIANKADKTLYAYNGNQLVATYPTTVGSTSTPSPSGTYKIVNKVKMPWYKATVGKDTDNKKVYMLPPGPNNPVGVVWMGLSKPSYGIHGSPVPEGISRQASQGCIRLTNWDVLEVYSNIVKGAKVELK